MFEGTIAQLVPLAALMPIVASIGGNTGNQTVALVVRGLALDQLRIGNAWHLLRKELTVGLLNGLIWGTTVGLFATIVYHSAPLGLVMTSALLLISSLPRSLAWSSRWCSRTRGAIPLKDPA